MMQSCFFSHERASKLTHLQLCKVVFLTYVKKALFIKGPFLRKGPFSASLKGRRGAAAAMLPAARLRGQRAAVPLLVLVAVTLVGLAGLRWRDPAGAHVELGYGCTPSMFVSCPGGVVPPGVTTPMQTSTPVSLAHLLSVVKKLRVRPPPPPPLS